MANAGFLPDAGEQITSPVTGCRYEFGEKIGEGFFGTVFSCFDQWGNDLAVKILKPTDGDVVRLQAAATAEIERLFALRHPNITFLYDAFAHRGAIYIFTERCHHPLTHVLSEPFRPPMWLHKVARCLLQAVHYLHVNSYAHQDIHLGNVLIAAARDEMSDDNPRALTFKLADLGVSRLFSELDAANTLNDAIRPPEAMSNEFGKLDHRIDIYQTGLLLLQLARAEEIRFTPAEILGGVPRQLALELPPPLDSALERALRRHVTARTPDAIQLWKDLHASPGADVAAVQLAVRTDRVARLGVGNVAPDAEPPTPPEKTEPTLPTKDG